MKTEAAKLFLGVVMVAAGLGMILGGHPGRAEAGGQVEQIHEAEPNPCGLASVVCEGEEDRVVIVTAYNSVPEQTDDTPCIAADGSDICQRRAKGETVCASNDWPLGAKIGLVGGVNGSCVVRDRMNARYTGTGRVDVYMGMDVQGAREFGIRKAIVTPL